MTTSELHTRAPVIDDVLPAFDVVISESVVVDGTLESTYEAARAFDFLRIRTPLALIRPFVGHIMRATLATIRRDVEWEQP
jgi:hypothetical protein